MWKDCLVQDKRTTITASELAKRASVYANAVVSQIEKLNETHPYSKDVSNEERKALENKMLEQSIPSREQLIAIFEQTFCHMMASRWIIVPDESLSPSEGFAEQ